MKEIADMSIRRYTALPRGKGETILLVDDDQECLQRIGDMLKRLGYEVIRRSSGDSAREVLRGKTVVVDLLISDYRMQGMDGLSLPQTERLSGGNTPAILLTGHDTIDAYLEATNNDDVYYARKPIDLKELGTLVQAALKRGPAVIP